MHFFNTIERPSMAEHKDKGSRFLAHSIPLVSVDEFRKVLKALKEEHPKAAHHCFAYRLGTDGNLYRTSDDNEPSGTAGKPILGQIDSKALTNVAVVVVRYFGGTLLGVPGLIQAYKTASSLCLQLTPIVQKPILMYYKLQFDYTLMHEVMIIVKRFGCVVTDQQLMLFCSMVVGVPKAEEAAFVGRFSEMHGVDVRRSTL